MREVALARASSTTAGVRLETENVRGFSLIPYGIWDVLDGEEDTLCIGAHVRSLCNTLSTCVRMHQDGMRT